MTSFTEFNWLTRSGLQIYGIDWKVNNPEAVVVLVHGLGEHCRRYDHFAKFLNERQIALLGFDLPGHGRSDGKRGHTPEGLETFLQVTEEALDQAAERYPDSPTILYGHSLGGNICLNYLLRKKKGILRGVTATGPWIRTGQKVSPLLEGFGRLLAPVLPGFLQPNGLDLNHLSTDPEVVRRYKEDPLVHEKISVKLGIEMLDAARWLDAYQGTIPLPTLLMHGSADQITNPQATIEFSKRVDGPVVLKIWESLFHEIHNEPQQSEVFNYFHGWLKNTIQ